MNFVSCQNHYSFTLREFEFNSIWIAYFIVNFITIELILYISLFQSELFKDQFEDQEVTKSFFHSNQPLNGLIFSLACKNICNTCRSWLYLGNFLDDAQYLSFLSMFDKVGSLHTFHCTIPFCVLSLLDIKTGNCSLHTWILIFLACF